VITAEKVRIICGRCLITIPGSLEGLGFQTCYSAFTQSPPPRFENQTFWGNYRKV